MRNRNRARLARLVIFSMAFAASAQAGTVSVSDGWIRALPGKTPAGGYFMLQNDSGKRIVLTGAGSPACGMLMLHKSEDESGMASMSEVAAITVPPGARLSFAPGGYHLMCTNPGRAIKPGNTVPVTLTFADGAHVTSVFKVRTATGR